MIHKFIILIYFLGLISSECYRDRELAESSKECRSRTISPEELGADTETGEYPDVSDYTCCLTIEEDKYCSPIINSLIETYEKNDIENGYKIECSGKGDDSDSNNSNNSSNYFNLNLLFILIILY